MKKRELMCLIHEEIYEDKRDLSFSLSGRAPYTEKQKRFAFESISAEETHNTGCRHLIENLCIDCPLVCCGQSNIVSE